MTSEAEARQETATFGVHFRPTGRSGPCRADESVLECARRLGIGINTICGGKGTCRACKVRIISGSARKPTPSEHEAFTPRELRDGWRLACQAYPLSDLELMVPAESMTALQRLQVEGEEVKVLLEPAVQVFSLDLAAPTLSAPQADADRLLQELKLRYDRDCREVDIDLLRSLPERLRSWDWRCQAIVRNSELVALLPPSRHPLGLAIDLGTTKIAGYLVDFTDGRTLAGKGLMNPQVSYGEDIISRINRAAKSQSDRGQLQKLAVGAINELCTDLCGGVSADTGEVVEAVVVGNTAMHHLFLNLPVKQLGLSPFVPAVGRAVQVKARDLGLDVAPGAYVYLLPNIAAFVGADHVAMLLAIGALQIKAPALALDIGTNTEISLLSEGAITTVSCASGPAFEGGHIKHGMRAAAGAIEHIRIVDDNVQYQTIEGAPPIGVCGSGILDAVAQLYLAKVIDESGRMMSNHPRIRNYRGQREFVLVSKEERGGAPAIAITEHDVRELQLAKAAIRAGIEVLLQVCNCRHEDLKQVIIAGAFGTYIDIASAVTIGMLPPLPRYRFRQVGNAAGMGAKLALVSLAKRAEAEAIASRVRYVELASVPTFAQTFVQASYLGRYRIRAGKREKLSDGD